MTQYIESTTVLPVDEVAIRHPSNLREIENQLDTFFNNIEKLVMGLIVKTKGSQGLKKVTKTGSIGEGTLKYFYKEKLFISFNPIECTAFRSEEGLNHGFRVGYHLAQ